MLLFHAQEKSELYDARQQLRDITNEALNFTLWTTGRSDLYLSQKLIPEQPKAHLSWSMDTDACALAYFCSSTSFSDSRCSAVVLIFSEKNECHHTWDPL